MIDSSKAPLSPTRRFATIGLLVVLLVAAGWFLWTKELHKSAATSTPPVPTIPAAAAQVHRSSSTSTTIPGGIPMSTRNPFAGQ